MGNVGTGNIATDGTYTFSVDSCKVNVPSVLIFAPNVEATMTARDERYLEQVRTLGRRRPPPMLTSYWAADIQT